MFRSGILVSTIHLNERKRGESQGAGTNHGRQAVALVRSKNRGKGQGEQMKAALTTDALINTVWAPVIAAMVKVESAVSNGSIKRKPVRDRLERDLLTEHKNLINLDEELAGDLPTPPSSELLEYCDRCEDLHLRAAMLHYPELKEYVCSTCSKTVRGRKERASLYAPPIWIAHCSIEEHVEGKNSFFKQTGWTLYDLDEDRHFQALAQAFICYTSGSITRREYLKIATTAAAGEKRELKALEAEMSQPIDPLDLI
jgi:hypothetical protein